MFGVGFPSDLGFNRHLLASNNLLWMLENSVWLLCLSVCSHNLLLGSSTWETSWQRNHTLRHTHKVTLMLSAVLWHMAASHTKLKPLNFPLVFQNRGCSFFQSGTVCACRAHKGDKNIRLQVWDARTDGAAGEKHTVPDFIKRNTNQPKGCRHIRTQHCGRKQSSASVYK